MANFSKVDVAFELNRLARFHEKPPLNEDRLDGFIEDLSKYRTEDVLHAIRDARKEFDRFPTLPQLIGLINSAPAAEFRDRSKVKCERCNNCGMFQVWNIYLYDEWGDSHISTNDPTWAVPYNLPIPAPHPEAIPAVARCECEHGRRHTGLEIYKGSVIRLNGNSPVNPINVNQEIAKISEERRITEYTPEPEMDVECPF